jgi:Cu/Zn superoxide dismutase
VACGILQETTRNVLNTETIPLGDSMVTSEITAITGVKEAGEVCFFGTANALERELVSFKADPVGTDCTAGNGCGLHVHSGISCTNSTTQGGHFYSTASDPWTTTGYLTTDADGSSGMFFDCVSTGESDMEGHAFVVHADNGSRVSCGLLLSEPEERSSPTAAPASSVGKLAPLASALAMLATAVITVTL